MGNGTNRSVARNASYSRGGVNKRERHNERENMEYSNPDVMLDYSHLNVNFKKCEGGYLETLDKIIAQGIVSTSGLKPTAKVIDELVFDVNTLYFNNYGGYEYAKNFFKEAYNYAVKKIGGEQYILSAVMHADERNRGLSQDFGYDVFHYHLHVVYIPVVKKEKLLSKRCKDKALIGTVKEVITQISHSKKWKSKVARDENGKEIILENGKKQLISSYSILQDEFFAHMNERGFEGFERGIKGSNTQHLDVLDFKVSQDTKKLNILKKEITVKENALSAIEQKVEQAKSIEIGMDTVEGIGRKKLFSNKIELEPKDYEHLVDAAKTGIALKKEVEELKEENSWLTEKVYEFKEKYENLLEATKEFREAMKLAPQKVKEFFISLFERFRKKDKPEPLKSEPVSVKDRLKVLQKDVNSEVRLKTKSDGFER